SPRWRSSRPGWTWRRSISKTSPHEPVTGCVRMLPCIPARALWRRRRTGSAKRTCSASWAYRSRRSPMSTVPGRSPPPWRRSACRRSSRPAVSVTTARASSASARKWARARPMPPGTRWGRRQSEPAWSWKASCLLISNFRWSPCVGAMATSRSEEHTSELQSRENLVCRPPCRPRLPLPAALPIFKTRRFGYDGKGQFRLRPEMGAGAANAAWDALGAQAERTGLVLEGFVPFDFELSVVAVRGRDGDFRSWAPTRNWHVDGVLSASLAPAGVDPAVEEQAVEYARRLAEALDYVGVFALELFCRDGRLLANEMAPRVHNSGHWTVEGAETSQFENHVRAVLGLPLGAT